MTKVEPILLIGAGGHCKSCIYVLSTLDNYEAVGIIDKKASNVNEVLGIKVIGTDSDLELLIQKFTNVLIAVGQIKSPNLRIKLFQSAKSLGALFPVVLSPTAQIAQSAFIEEGTICFHQTIINASVNVGKNCIINNKALIEHDTQIGSHCHISTGSLINGGVVIEDGCFIGSGSILREGVKVGAGSVIGAGIVVKEDVPSGSLLR
jgi:sugar O-acyltransferase (sialic acid O-acetyltransferase NeuD family)